MSTFIAIFGLTGDFRGGYGTPTALGIVGINTKLHTFMAGPVVRFPNRSRITPFFVLCLIIGNIFENLGLRTGFPFGPYYFTDLMGPKLFLVPILLGLAYVGMAYLSWTVASLILGRGMPSLLAGSRVLTLPLLASLIMVAWDLSQDPVWSTILHAWIWLNGGAYFGVPVSNFFGWYLIVYVFYQLFALYLGGRSPNSEPLPPSYWHLAVLFYGISAAGNILLVIPVAGLSVVSDPTGAQWKVSDITHACAFVSIFIMGTFALLAWIRLADQKAKAGKIPIAELEDGGY